MSACPVCGMTAPHDGPCPASAQPWILQKRYEIVKQLGQGGMGTVYLAHDLRLHNRLCVVKKLRDDIYKEEDKQKALELFSRESHVLSQLQHPNIVHILDYFEEDQEYFLVMEYVEGKDLHTSTKENNCPFAENQVLKWSLQVADVLNYLHGHNPPVIYRDLKPSNIMIDSQGQIKLVDFGIARLWKDTNDSVQVVSGGYSSPEQYWGRADPRSDIYSLGATMFYLLTAKEPVALHRLSARSEDTHISKQIDGIIQCSTAQNPQERYQTAQEMLKALEYAAQYQQLKLRSKSSAIILAAVLVFACLALIAYQKFASTIREKQALLMDRDETILQQRKEQNALIEKLEAYSHALSNPSNPTSAKAHLETNALKAVEETREYQLTDHQ